MSVLVHDDQERAGPDEAYSRFPRLPLYSAFGLVLFALAAVLFGQSTDIGTVRETIGAPAAIRDIVIMEEADGTVSVSDAMTRAPITRVGEADGGFLRGALPALKRMRLIAGSDASHPYRVIRWESGAVSISDTVTGERIYLNAFGPDIVAQFAALLDR